MSNILIIIGIIVFLWVMTYLTCFTSAGSVCGHRMAKRERCGHVVLASLLTISMLMILFKELALI